jgi:iron(III) transport system permease protein
MAISTAEQASRLSFLRRGERLANAAVLVLSLIVALPVITVLVLAFLPAENIWPHMLATVLPGYIWRTLLLMSGVGALSFVIGTGTAWLVTMCRFPARKVFQWALLVPLALPTYIVAYTYVDFLTYAGPLQGWLRSLAGWKTPHDYWFPEIRSIGGGIVILAFVLYPSRRARVSLGNRQASLKWRAPWGARPGALSSPSHCLRPARPSRSVSASQ